MSIDANTVTSSTSPKVDLPTKKQRIIASLITLLPLVVAGFMIQKGISIYHGEAGWLAPYFEQIGMPFTGTVWNLMQEWLFLLLIVFITSVMADHGSYVYLYGYSRWRKEIKRQEEDKARKERIATMKYHRRNLQNKGQKRKVLGGVILGLAIGFWVF